MLFAVTRDRRRPRPGDVLSGRADMERRLPELASARSVTLWEAMRDEDGDDEDEWGFVEKARIVVPWTTGADRLSALLAEAALGAARGLYMTGDCWSLAAVAAGMLDRPVALFVSDPHRETGEPDHVAVDLGDGRYLDIRGVLEADGVAAGLNTGARPEPATVDVAGLKAVYARHYGKDGHSLDESLACNGWEDSTRALIEMFLLGPATDALSRAPAPSI